MMKKLVALLMALALLCTSIGAFADELESETPQIQQEAELQPLSDPDPDPAPHVHDYVPDESTAEDPTKLCTEAVTVLWYCNVEGCDEPVSNGPYGPLGHIYQLKETVKAPTHIEEGEEIWECSRCGETKTEHPEKLVAKYPADEKYSVYVQTPNDPYHKAGWANPDMTEDPTCTEDGYLVVRCADCGDSYHYTTEDLEKTGHNWNGHTPDSEISGRTCTTPGVKTYKGYCYTCEQEVTWTEPIEALGHLFEGVKGVVTQNKDCTHDELTEYACARGCGYTETRVTDTKLGHTWEDPNWVDQDVHIVEEATCAKAGSVGMAQVCGRDGCGEVKPESVNTVHRVDPISHTDEWKARVNVTRVNSTDPDSDPLYVADEAAFIEKVCQQLSWNGESTEGITDIDSLFENVDRKALLKAIENVTIELFPIVTYTISDEQIIDLVTKDTIPEYKTKFAEFNGKDVMGLVHETKVVYNAPSCTANGSIVLTCTECDAEPYVITLPMTDHAYHSICGVEDVNSQEGVNVTDCTKPNAILFQCLYCGDRYNQAFEPAANHTWKLDTKDFDPADLVLSESKIIAFVQQKVWDKKPLTYEVGFKRNINADNFAKYKRKVAAAFENIAVCRDYDIIVECCVEFCNVTTTIHVEGNEQHFASNLVIDTDPGCTTPGYLGFNCEKCGKFHTEEVPPTGHTPVLGDTIDAPSCATVGHRKIVCDVCEAELGVEEIPAIGHHWAPFSTSADCKNNKKGISYRYCTVCDYIDPDSVVEDDGHDYDEDDITGYTAPGCESYGKVQFVCKNCHTDQERQINPTGHTEYITKIEPASCEPGKEHGVRIHYACSNVDSAGRKCIWTDIKDDGKIPAHNMFKTDDVSNDDGQVIKTLNRFTIKDMPTCEIEGKAEYVCSVCNTRQELVLPKIPHNYELVFDDEEGAYNLVCVEMKNTAANRNKLLTKLKDGAYKDMAAVAEVIVNMLARTDANESFNGIGCEDTQPIEVRNTHFSIGRLPGHANRGYIKLDEGAMGLKPGKEPYILLTMMYVTSNGDTISLCDIRSTSEVWNEELGWIFTFKISGNGTLSDGVRLEDIYAEVVTDPDADEAEFGSFKIYGEGEL